MPAMRAMNVAALDANPLAAGTIVHATAIGTVNMLDDHRLARTVNRADGFTCRGFADHDPMTTVPDMPAAGAVMMPANDHDPMAVVILVAMVRADVVDVDIGSLGRRSMVVVTDSQAAPVASGDE